MRILSFYGFSTSYGLYLIHVFIFHLYNDAAARFAPALRVGESFGVCVLRLGMALVVATAVAYLLLTNYL